MWTRLVCVHISFTFQGMISMWTLVYIEHHSQRVGGGGLFHNYYH